MVGLKYIGSVLVAIVLCGGIWLVQPAKEQVSQLENQISRQYLYANYLLMETVDELLAWNFSQPLTDPDKDYLYKLSNELRYTTGLIFSGDVVHHEWRSQMNDIQRYLSNYMYGTSLSEEDVADINQSLQATRYITMDFDGYIDNTFDFYDAMHDEQHEMVEIVKSRLASKY